jgi:hypothetical protein
MNDNPVSDPTVMLGYAGCRIRCVARRQPDGTFRSVLRVKEDTSPEDRILFECTFEMTFPNPDAAIEWAMSQGQRVVARHLEYRERKLHRWRA